MVRVRRRGGWKGDSNPGGPGGSTRKIQGNKPPRKGICDCPMGAAVRAARRGRFRLAGRYARMAARLVAARFA